MKKYLGIYENKNLIRDADSKGVINIDNESLNKYREERDYKLKLARVVSEHETMKSDIADIKGMLSELLERLK